MNDAIGSTRADGPPLILALETSTRRPSVAARRDGVTRSVQLDGARAHASDLLPAIDALFAELDAPRTSLARVIVGLGPGSLTGTRVGAATAQGLVVASGAELVGVPSFEAAVHAVARDGERVLVLNDARGGRYDAAEYVGAAASDGAGGAPRVARAPHSLTVVEATERAAAFDGTLLIADATTLERLAVGDGVQVIELAPRADVLLELGADRTPLADPATLEPLYLRDWEARTVRRG